MRERARGGIERGGIAAVEHAQAVQRPQCMDGRGIQTDLVDGAIVDDLGDLRDDVGPASLDEEALLKKYGR